MRACTRKRCSHAIPSTEGTKGAMKEIDDHRGGHGMSRGMEGCCSIAQSGTIGLQDWECTAQVPKN